jgi:hypothetical protein
MTTISTPSGYRKGKRSRRNIVDLMRGDIIRFKSESQLNDKIYFIDYIDERNIRLVEDMRNDNVDKENKSSSTSKFLNMELLEGRFPLEFRIKSIELLYRNNKEQGYARQRGLTPGKWIEIEYETPKDGVTLMVYGEIKSLEDGTDCIGVSIYDSSKTQQEYPFIYIDFEFKGLSEDLHIKSIKICNKPRSLLDDAKRNTDEAKETPVEEPEPVEEPVIETVEGEYSEKVNVDFQRSPPSASDNRLEQSKQIDEGDKIVISFFENSSESEDTMVRILEEARYYSLEEQQRDLLEALIDIAPTSKTHHLSRNKEYVRMIERYTQLREMYSVYTEQGNIVSKPMYGNMYKPMATALYSNELVMNGLDYNFTNDWLMPIYVEKRVIYCMDETEETVFESRNADVNNIVTRLTRDQAEYEQYYTGKSTFLAFLNNMKTNMTPYALIDSQLSNYRTLSKRASLQGFSTNYSDVKSLQVPAFNKSKTWSTCLNMTRYIGDDNILEMPSAFMVRPYPFVAFGNMKALQSSIADKTNARVINEVNYPTTMSVHSWWALTAPIVPVNEGSIDPPSCGAMFKQHMIDVQQSSENSDVESSMRQYHDMFANRMNTEIYISKRFNKTAIYNFIPTTESLVHKMIEYFKPYYMSLSPNILVKNLTPFFILPEHVTHHIFLVLSKFIKDHISIFKSSLKIMKRKYEAYESLTYPGFGKAAGPTINSLYLLLTDPSTTKDLKTMGSSKKGKQVSIFETSVISKYPVKEWMIKSDDNDDTSQHKILSSSELLSRTFMSDFGKCLLNEVIQLNITSDNLYGVNVSGVIDHFVEEAEKITGVVKGANEVVNGNKQVKEGKFILAKRYVSMDDLNQDNESSRIVPIAYDAAFDPTDYEFIQKYEKERRKMPDDVFKAFLIDKYHHMQQVKKKQKLSAVECAYEVNSMLAGRRIIRPNLKERAVLVVSSSEPLPGELTGDDSVMNPDAYVSSPEAEVAKQLATEYRYYKLGAGSTWELDDTIPPSVTPENTDFFGNIFPGEIVMKNNCLSPNTGITAESSTVVTSMAKADLISKITHEFDGIIESKYEQFLKEFSDKKEYYDYRLASELLIYRTKQLSINNKHYQMGQRAMATKQAADVSSTSELAVSPHRDILNVYLGNGSFPRMQELIVSFAKTYTRKANRPCAGSPLDVDADLDSEPNVEIGESCEWLYCKDSGAKLMPVWMLDKANAYLSNDAYGEKSYTSTMDRICREYGIIEGGVWVDGKKCKSGFVIMEAAFSTYEGVDEQGFKIKTHSVVTMEDDEEILLGEHGSKPYGNKNATQIDDERLKEQTYIQYINKKFSNEDAHKINDVVTPILKLGLGIAPDRNGLRDMIITSVIHTVTNLKRYIFYSEKKYIEKNASKKKYPSYESYCDLSLLMTTLVHIIVVIQTAIPDIRPSKTFRNCKVTFNGYPLDGDGDNRCIEYIACVAMGVKDSSKDIWIPVLGLKVDQYVSNIRSILDIILKNETDGHLDMLITAKRNYRQEKLKEEIDATERRQQLLSIKKWTQFLPLLTPLKGIVHPPNPITKGGLESFVRSIKNGSHVQHEQLNLLRSKIMHYSFYIQKMIQEWIQSGSAEKTSLVLFTTDHRPALENSCCDDVSMVKPFRNRDGKIIDSQPSKPKGAISNSVLEYFITNANENIREFNEQIGFLNNSVTQVSNMSKSYILTLDGTIVHSIDLALDPFYNLKLSGRPVSQNVNTYSDDTMLRGFIHFFKLDYPNAYIEPSILELKSSITIPETYDPRSDFADKIEKLKSKNSNISEHFERVLDEVNRNSILDTPSTMMGSISKEGPQGNEGRGLSDSDVAIYDSFKVILDELNHVPEIQLFDEELRELIHDVISVDNDTSIDDKQDIIIEKLNSLCSSSKEAIRSFITSKQGTDFQTKFRSMVLSAPEQIMKFIGLLEMNEANEIDNEEFHEKKALSYLEDASNEQRIRFITFIKNAIRYMLQTVPGLLLTSETGNDKDQYVSSKHWKFGTAHNNDISRCIDTQYTGLATFRDSPEIRSVMRRINSGSDYINTAYLIIQLIHAIPLSTSSGRGIGRLKYEVVKQMYIYLFYKTIELYTTVSGGETGSIRLNLSAVQPSSGIQNDGPATEFGNMDSSLIDDVDAEFDFMASRRSTADKMRELLIVVMTTIIKMKNTNTITLTNMRKVMASIRRKETEDMRYSFYMSSTTSKTDAFQIKKTMLKLRIGEYSVGAQVGYRKYDRDFDERERDARNKRIAEGKGDPNQSFEAFEDEMKIIADSDAAIDGHQAIEPTEGDEYVRDQLMQNEIEIVNTC